MKGAGIALVVAMCLATACADDDAEDASEPTPPVSTTPPTVTTSPPTVTTSPPTTAAPPSTATATTGGATTTVESHPLLFDGSPEVEPGTYTVDRVGTPIAVTVPAGWATLGDFALLGPEGSYLAFWDVADVFTDACAWTRGTARIGTSVDDLVEGLVAQGGSDTGEPQVIEVDGHVGAELVLSVPADLDVAACDDGELKVWREADGGERFYGAAGETETVWILDLDERRAVVNFGSPAPLSTATQTQLAELVASLTIG